AEAAVERAHDDGRQRQQHDHAQPERGDAEAQRSRVGAPGGASGDLRGRRERCRGGAHLAVDTPASSSIFAIEPFSTSKNSSLTFSQPPRSSIVKRPGGFGNRPLAFAALKTSSLTGR